MVVNNKELEKSLIESGISPQQLRFSEALWAQMSESRSILIGGAGGIGSWLSLYLSRIGIHQLNLVDFDSFEEVNMAGQFVEVASIGKNKAEATYLTLQNFSLVDNFYHYPDKLTKENINDYIFPVVFSCFDNMEARKLMFEAWKQQDNREVFIDGRMTAEYYEVYLVFKGREEEYEKTLFSDSEGGDLMCSYKATSHCGAMVAGEMVNLFNQYIVNKNGGMVFEIPFKIIHNMMIGGSYQVTY